MTRTRPAWRQASCCTPAFALVGRLWPEAGGNHGRCRETCSVWREQPSSPCDYSRARPDYTCEQRWGSYTAEEHDRFKRLFARQMEHIVGRACDPFIASLHQLGDPSEIPRFDDLNHRLERVTGWRIVAVPGLIPEHDFFALLAQRRFPITDWLRTEDEFDYIVEPDLFHDLFGHLPLLFNPVFADYMQAYGTGGLKAEGLHALEYLSRLYWYTVEFGLLNTPEGLRVYGAGILSSLGELD